MEVFEWYSSMSSQSREIEAMFLLCKNLERSAHVKGTSRTTIENIRSSTKGFHPQKN